MSDIKKDYIFYGFIIVFSVFFLFVTPQIKITNSSFIIGPRDWPYILLIGMLGFSVFGVIKSFVKSKRLKVRELETVYDEVNPGPAETEKTAFKLSVPMVALTSIIIYVILLNLIGFIISTVLFLFGITFLLGQKKKVNAAIFAIVTTTVFVLLFTSLLEIPLPRGIGIFRQFSLLFY